MRPPGATDQAHGLDRQRRGGKLGVVPRSHSWRSCMTISALIIDDEELARDELAYLLEAGKDVDGVAQGANGIEAVELIEEHHPELVFLDVQMPGLGGVALIQRGKERHRK